MINPYFQKIRQDYIQEYRESASKVHYTALTEADGVRTVFYDDLPHTAIDGYPFASDFVAADGTVYDVERFNTLDENTQKGCKLRFYYLPYSHEMYLGTTGSGKTTGCVEPQLRAISSQKNKPNLFLTDPKGELFDHNAKHLIDNGYRVFVLNFKDIFHTDKWNPLAEMYDLKLEAQHLAEKCILREGPVDPALNLIYPLNLYNEAGYIQFEDKALPNGTCCDQFLAFQKDFLEAHIDDIINQTANMMIQVQSKNDKTWEYGAQNLLKGILHCMLEDAINPESGFTKDMMTLNTLQQYYLALKTPILADDTSLRSHYLMEGKSSKPIALMSTALANAPNTMRSYCGVFDDAVKDWFQGHIFALTTGHTINLFESDAPFAIFLITRDYEKSDFVIAGLFIDWVYRQTLERAERSADKPRALHFMLDEFGNIPAIRDLENKISTARSRNIWFHLVVQSYMQVEAVYGHVPSIVIKDNCNAQIFLGAQNRETKEAFSRDCGIRAVPTLESLVNPSVHSLENQPLLPVSALDLIKPGQIYTKRLYMPLISSQFIRSYVCAEQGTFHDFFDSHGLVTCTPTCTESFTSEKFIYPNLVKKPKRKSSFSDFDF